MHHAKGWTHFWSYRFKGFCAERGLVFRIRAPTGVVSGLGLSYFRMDQGLIPALLLGKSSPTSKLGLLRREVVGAVPLGKLLRRVTGYPIYSSSPLDRRSGSNRVRPALDICVVLHL